MGVTKIFFSCETADISPTSDMELISIGMIAESGEMFYGEVVGVPHDIPVEYPIRTIKALSDYTDEWTCWEICNVLRLPMQTVGNENVRASYNNHDFVIGDEIFVNEHLRTWLDNFDDSSGNRSVTLVGSSCYYDIMALHRLLLKHGEWPEHVCVAAYDIGQDRTPRKCIGNQCTYLADEKCFDRGNWEYNESLGKPEAPTYTALANAELVRLLYNDMVEEARQFILVGKPKRMLTSLCKSVCKRASRIHSITYGRCFQFKEVIQNGRQD